MMLVRAWVNFNSFPDTLPIPGRYDDGRGVK